jgi:hypothetical protein
VFCIYQLVLLLAAKLRWLLFGCCRMEFMQYLYCQGSWCFPHSAPCRVLLSFSTGLMAVLLLTLRGRDGAEQLSVDRAMRAVTRAEVVVIVVDGSEGVTQQARSHTS